MSGPASLEGTSPLAPCDQQIIAAIARDPRQGVVLARQCYANSERGYSLDHATAATLLGYALLYAEQFHEAADWLNVAAAHLPTDDTSLLRADIQRAHMFLNLLRGTVPAIDAWAALAAHYDACGAALAAARTRLGQMIALNTQGKVIETLTLADQVRPVFAAQGTLSDQAWLARATAVAYIYAGAFAKAEMELDAAETGFDSLAYPAELAKTWLERTRLYEFQGRLRDARATLEQAYTVVQEYNLPLRMAFCTKYLGWLAALLGEYDRSLLFSLRAIDQFVQLRRYVDLADCDLNLGNIAYYAGLPELALAAYQRAEQLYTQHQDDRMHLICRRNCALVLRLTGHLQAALTALDTLQVAATSLDQQIELAEIVFTRGLVYADLGWIERAQIAFVQAKTRFQTLQNPASSGRALLELGRLSLSQSKTEQAYQWFQQATDQLHEQPIHRWRALYGLGRCAEGFGDVQAALEQYREACLLVARLRQRLANEHASSGLFLQAQALVEDAIGLAVRCNDGESVLYFAELQRALTLIASTRASTLHELHQALADVPLPDHQPDGAMSLEQHLEARLRRRDVRLVDDETTLAPINIPALRADLQHAFPDGWTLLVYVPCRKQIVLTMLTDTTITVLPIPYTADVQDLLEQATAPQHRPRTYALMQPTPDAAQWPVLTNLGDTLVPPVVQSRLHPDHRLVIVAGGELHNVPWATVRPGSRWLVEQCTPQVIPGLAMWQQLLRRTPMGDATLLIGVSQFATRAPALRGVRATLDVAARWSAGAITRREDAAATVQFLRESARNGALHQYRVIQFATHGQLMSGSGILAHLKLADDDLYYDTITRLDLRGALVILSTCEGAASEILPGDELLGLSQAFITAGARDIIASGWQLYDRTTALLFDRFYHELAAGYDPPTALARMQRIWLTQGTGDSQLDTVAKTPFVWGGLCALGAGAYLRV
jgi:CHAT domain-containing protein/tetratricopeptide (TPR) repeat protein